MRSLVILVLLLAALGLFVVPEGRGWLRAQFPEAAATLDGWLGLNPAPETTKKASGSAARGAIPVLVAPVSYARDDRLFEAVGTARARISAQVQPAVAGEVVAVGFKAGEAVNKGQLLVQLDDRAEKLAVRLAKVRVDDAKNLLRRYEQAVSDGAVPQSEVDAARGELESAQVALEQAQLNLSLRRVLAPFAGHVGIPTLGPGERIGSSTVVTGLDDRRVLFVDFEIPEALVGALRSDDPAVRQVSATTPAFPAQTFEGTIGASDARIDPDRRTLRVRVTLANDDDQLRPGMSFNIRWTVPGERYLSVPEMALQWAREGAFLWQVDAENTVHRVPASVVRRLPGRVLVDAALKDDAVLVIEGVQRLREGARVAPKAGQGA